MKFRSIAPMRAAKIGYIIISAAFCILGIFLIAIPEFSVSFFGILCGALLIVFGCVRLLGYFSRDLYRLAFQYDLVFGILFLVLGVLLLLYPKSLLSFLSLALGVFILSDGLFKIRIAVEAKQFGIREWWLILGAAILTGVCGGILLFCPKEGNCLIAVLLGIAFLSEGILNLSTVITAVKVIKHQKPDVIDRNYYEESED